MSERISISDRTRRHRLLSDDAKPLSLSGLPDNLPLSLKEACDRVFGGAISVASLRAEHARGNLEISKIGRAYFTTPADLRAMFARCRVAMPLNSNPNQVKKSDEARVAAASIALKLRLDNLREARRKTK